MRFGKVAGRQSVLKNGVESSKVFDFAEACAWFSGKIHAVVCAASFHLQSRRGGGEVSFSHAHAPPHGVSEPQ